MAEEEHFRKLERMYSRAPINAFFKPELRIGEGRAEVRIPVREDFFHAAGAAHGSLYFKALDDAAFFAVNSLVPDVFVLTVSFNVYLVRPLTGGELRALGRVIDDSKRLYVAEARLFDGEGRPAGSGSGTFMPSRIRLTPEVGYS